MALIDQQPAARRKSAVSRRRTGGRFGRGKQDGVGGRTKAHQFLRRRGFWRSTQELEGGGPAFFRDDEFDKRHGVRGVVSVGKSGLEPGFRIPPQTCQPGWARAATARLSLSVPGRFLACAAWRSIRAAPDFCSCARARPLSTKPGLLPPALFRTSESTARRCMGTSSPQTTNTAPRAAQPKT